MFAVDNESGRNVEFVDIKVCVCPYVRVVVASRLSRVVDGTKIVSEHYIERQTSVGAVSISKQVLFFPSLDTEAA